MSRFRLFIENFLVYGLGGIISKIIPFVMVPVITRIMPDTGYFGISDLSATIVSFASALAVIGMYDAMYRMFFEKSDEEYKRKVCSTTWVFTGITSVCVAVGMIIFQRPLALFFFHDEDLAYVVVLSAAAAMVSAANTIIAAPTRMQNKRKIFLVTNLISPLISYSMAVLLMLRGAYIIALPVAGIIAGIIMESSFFILNKEWFSIKCFDRGLLKQLLGIALPLFPNFLIYWVFNSSDKIMISNILSVVDVGIYSVGSKLGHASQLIYTAFAGGWQYFAFSTMDDEHQVENNSKIFEYLGIISFVCTSFVCAWSFHIYKVLFPEEYISGYLIAPYLFLAPLLQMLFQVIGNQFLVVKKTWPNMFILSGAAVVNIMLNLFLIPRIGIEGASIATLLGYVIADIVCMAVLLKMKLMVLSGKFLIAAAALILYLAYWRGCLSSDFLVGNVLALAYTMLCGFLYHREFNCIVIRIRRMVLKWNNKW